MISILLVSVFISLVFVKESIFQIAPQTATISGPDEIQTENQFESAEFVSAIYNELEVKGWGDIDIIVGEIDSSKWENFVIDTTDVDEDTVLYTIFGKGEGLYDNPITVVVEITFNVEISEWKRRKVFYVSEAGRYMEEDLDSNEILAVDDKVLWDYMYSY